MTNQEKLWRVVQLAAELHPKLTELYQLMGIVPTEGAMGGVEEPVDPPKKERKKWTHQEQSSNGKEQQNNGSKKKFKKKSCCGSNGPRHMTDCVGGMGREERIKEPTFGLFQLNCLDCGFNFKYKGDKLDAVCPKCKKTHVYPTAKTPEDDTLYEPEAQV